MGEMFYISSGYAIPLPSTPQSKSSTYLGEAQNKDLYTDDIFTRIRNILTSKGYTNINLDTSNLLEGGFGTVIKVECDSGHYALKMPLPAKDKRMESSIKQMKNEEKILTILQNFNEEQFLPLIDTIHIEDLEGQKLTCTLMDFMSNGNLLDYIENNSDEYDDYQRCQFKFYELLIDSGRQLIRFNEIGLIHRDIKPENILVKPDGRHFTLNDFGLSVWANDVEGLKAFAGTEGYMAPEVMTGKTNVKSDIFSLGMIFMELINFGLGFGVHDPLDNVKELVSQGNSDDKSDMEEVSHMHFIQKLIEIVEAMVEKDYNKRPSASEVVEFAEKELKPLLPVTTHCDDTM